MPSLNGTQPRYLPERGFRTWLANQIFTGPDGEGEEVPNIDDLVINWNEGLMRCIAVDSTTGLSTLVPHVFPDLNLMSDNDIVLGVGPGRLSETFRMMIDTSVVPHLLIPDSRLFVRGEANTHVKYFQGVDISDGGTVISQNYNQSGDFISENIPLVNASIDVDNNLSTKVPSVGNTGTKLNDGDPVTMVTYNNLGMATSVSILLAKNTGYIRRSDAAQKMVTHISLTSPFLSDTDDHLIQIPLNLPKDNLFMVGKVHYSDGSSRSVPIDGTQMSLFGINNFISTTAGQKVKLVLSYNLQSNEISDDIVIGSDRGVSASYQLETIVVDGSYSVKLFVVPRWLDGTSTWKLEYYLYSLERNDFYIVTDYIEYASNQLPFDPTNYGTVQWLTVALDLSKVDVRLKAYRYVQTFSISLIANGLVDSTSWMIQYSQSQHTPYGVDMKALVTLRSNGSWDADITNGHTSLTSWLEATYFNIFPLYHPTRESKPPLPTHFVMNLNGLRTEYAIEEWNTALESITGGSVGDVLLLEWVRKVGNTPLQLAMSPLKVIHGLPEAPAVEEPPEANVFTDATVRVDFSYSDFHRYEHDTPNYGETGSYINLYMYPDNPADPGNQKVPKHNDDITNDLWMPYVGHIDPNQDNGRSYFPNYRVETLGDLRAVLNGDDSIALTIVGGEDWSVNSGNDTANGPADPGTRTLTVTRDDGVPFEYGDEIIIYGTISNDYSVSYVDSPLGRIFLKEGTGINYDWTNSTTFYLSADSTQRNLVEDWKSDTYVTLHARDPSIPYYSNDQRNTAIGQFVPERVDRPDEGQFWFTAPGWSMTLDADVRFDNTPINIRRLGHENEIHGIDDVLPGVIFEIAHVDNRPFVDQEVFEVDVHINGETYVLHAVYVAAGSEAPLSTRPPQAPPEFNNNEGGGVIFDMVRNDDGSGSTFTVDVRAYDSVQDDAAYNPIWDDYHRHWAPVDENGVVGARTITVDVPTGKDLMIGSSSIWVWDRSAEETWYSPYYSQEVDSSGFVNYPTRWYTTGQDYELGDRVWLRISLYNLTDEVGIDDFIWIELAYVDGPKEDTDGTTIPLVDTTHP